MRRKAPSRQRPRLSGGTPEFGLDRHTLSNPSPSPLQVAMTRKRSIGPLTQQLSQQLGIGHRIHWIAQQRQPQSIFQSKGETRPAGHRLYGWQRLQITPHRLAKPPQSVRHGVTFLSSKSSPKRTFTRLATASRPPSITMRPFPM